jgi:phospholipid transport system substrate-binding protein
MFVLGLSGGASAAEPPAPSAASGSSTMDPQELVENSAKRMLRELDANREMYRKDPAKLDALVANVLLPNFDTEYAARLVLGQTWRTATPEQRKRFVDAFYHSLLRNYGTALLDFTADRFTILPYKGDPNATTATVRTEVKRSNGDKVPVNFSLHKVDGMWKAWDVVIEGISYVKSFKTDFGAEIQQKGLDEVINRLETEGKIGSHAAPVSSH